MHRKLNNQIEVKLSQNLQVKKHVQNTLYRERLFQVHPYVTFTIHANLNDRIATITTQLLKTTQPDSLLNAFNFFSSNNIIYGVFAETKISSNPSIAPPLINKFYNPRCQSVRFWANTRSASKLFASCFCDSQTRLNAFTYRPNRRVGEKNGQISLTSHAYAVCLSFFCHIIEERSS